MSAGFLLWKGAVFRSSHIPGPLALGMLALTLLVYNLGGWYLYEISRDRAERELGRRMVAIGRTVALELDEFNTPLLLLIDPAEGLDSDLNWAAVFDRTENLRERLIAIRDANGLENVTLLDRNRRVLADANGHASPGARLPALDSTFIADAFSRSEPALTPYYRFQEQEYKRCYVPVENRSGQPIAALRLSAGRAYFNELHRMRVYLIAISIVGSLLLAGVAVALYGLLVNALRSERAMADADRLQSLGTLAAGIAHEIRNPLGIIRAISEELTDELSDQPEQQELVRDVTEEVDRLNQMVTNFLTFARPGAAGSAPKPFSLAAALDDVVQLVRKGSDKERLRLICEHNGTIPPVLMEERSIRQVMLNVLLNAREAIGSEGEVRVRLDRVGSRARLRVSDDGPGMDARRLKRVFDPFFTTKKSGTGLGLSISRNIAIRYGGDIEIESEPGRGTTVTVWLPLKGGLEAPPEGDRSDR